MGRTTIDSYPVAAISGLISQLKWSLSNVSSSKFNEYAIRLINCGIKHDLLKFENLELPAGAVDTRGDVVERDAHNPPNVVRLFTNKALRGRFATYNNDAQIVLNADEKFTSFAAKELKEGANIAEYMNKVLNDLDIYPGINFGLKGLLTAYPGKNSVVDFGNVVIHEEEIHFFGGERGDTGEAAFLGGFDEGHSFTVVREIVEEAVDIDPLKMSPEMKIEYDKRDIGSLKNKNEPGNNDDRTAYAEVKRDFIEEFDPEFFERLKKLSISGPENYNGINLCANRNSNSAYLATSFRTIILNPESLNAVFGSNKLGYSFEAGDDLGKVKLHKLSPELIDNSFDSHGAFQLFLTAGYLLEEQKLATERNQQVNISDLTISQIDKVLKHVEEKGQPELNFDLQKSLL